MPRLTIRVALFSVLALLFVVFLASYARGIFRHPSDAVLETRFYTHEAEFNQLISMVLSDGTIFALTPDSVYVTDPVQGAKQTSTDSLPPGRFMEYHKVFQELGIREGLVKDGKMVMIKVDAPSFFNGGSQKGYMYSPNPLPVCQLDDLNKCAPPYGAKARSNYSITYRPLSKNWYLFLLWG